MQAVPLFLFIRNVVVSVRASVFDLNYFTGWSFFPFFLQDSNFDELSRLNEECYLGSFSEVHSR
jgi:hypothetical protein